MQFTPEQLGKMSPEVRAWAIQNGYAQGGTPNVGFGMQQSSIFPQNQTVSNLGMSGEPNQMIPHPLAPSARVSAGGQMISPTPSARGIETGTGGYIPTDQSINTLGADPNYGQFYNSMRNTYNVANSTKNLPPVGSSGYFSADAFAQQTAEQSAQEAVAKSLAEEGAKGGAKGLTFGSPEYIAGNLLLSAIPTRDKQKINTPLGSEGSGSGIVKGAGKGALLGSSIDVATGGTTLGMGAGIGGLVGAIGGAQGYFDTTSPTRIQPIGLLRGGQNRQLTAPKGMYG